MTATIQRVDDNYVVALPVNILERIKIKESEVVRIFEEYGRIIIQKSEMSTIVNDTTRKTIDEMFENYDGDYEPVQIDWGTPVGNEIW